MLTWAYPISPQFVNRNVSLGPKMHPARYSCGQRRCSISCVPENPTAYSWPCFVFTQSCHGYWWVVFFKTQRICRNIKRFLKKKALNSCGAGGGGGAGNTPAPSSFFTFRFSSHTEGVTELLHASKLGGWSLQASLPACSFRLRADWEHRSEECHLH